MVFLDAWALLADEFNQLHMFDIIAIIIPSIYFNIFRSVLVDGLILLHHYLLEWSVFIAQTASSPLVAYKIVFPAWRIWSISIGLFFIALRFIVDALRPLLPRGLEVIRESRFELSPDHS
jgi:hypothetical protein